MSKLYWKNEEEWTRYREGLDKKIKESGFAENDNEATFQADFLVLILKHFNKEDGMDWDSMEAAIEKIVGQDGYMGICGY